MGAHSEFAAASREGPSGVHRVPNGFMGVPAAVASLGLSEHMISHVRAAAGRARTV